MSILCVTLFEDVCNLRFIKKKITFLIQCPPLNRITLGQHKSDNNNRMIQLTDVFCVLFRYITGSVVCDYNNRNKLIKAIIFAIIISKNTRY